MAAYDSNPDEPPLDPGAERLRRRLARLLLISGGFMVLGLIAVFSAIVYKVGGAGNTDTGAPPRFTADQPVQGRITIPAGARLVSSALDDGQVLLTIEGPDRATSLLLVDLASGEILGRYNVGEE